MVVNQLKFHLIVRKEDKGREASCSHLKETFQKIHMCSETEHKRPHTAQQRPGTAILMKPGVSVFQADGVLAFHALTST